MLMSIVNSTLRTEDWDLIIGRNFFFAYYIRASSKNSAEHVDQIDVRCFVQYKIISSLERLYNLEFILLIMMRMWLSSCRPSFIFFKVDYEVEALTYILSLILCSEKSDEDNASLKTLRDASMKTRMVKEAYDIEKHHI